MTELRALLGRLVQMLDSSGVPFMIAGSFASTAHGLPRTTQDLDVVIDPPSPQALDAFVGSLSPDDYYVDADAARDPKVEWSQQSGGSERQRRDVAGIVATMGEQLDRAYIELWIRPRARRGMGPRTEDARP